MLWLAVGALTLWCAWLTLAVRALRRPEPPARDAGVPASWVPPPGTVPPGYRGFDPRFTPSAEPHTYTPARRHR